MNLIQFSGKEKREVLKATIDRIEREMRECNNFDINIKVNGKNVFFRPKITFNQADKKVLKEICGCNGSYCFLCFITKELASNPEVIRRGFEVQKDITDIISKATELESQGKLNSKTRSEVREGITHMPLESGSLQSNHIIPPLHAKLNILNNVLELLYLNNAR